MTHCTSLAETNAPWIYYTRRHVIKLDVPEGILQLQLDGCAMITLDGMYQEFKSILNFPEYFGENLNALDECLTDLEWLPAKGYILSIKNAEVFLKNEPDVVFEGLMSILNNAGEEWAAPVAQGEAWDRIGLPFHTVLELGSFDVSGFQKRLRQLDFEVSELP